MSALSASKSPRFHAPGTLPTATNSIDASGLIVTPGIIDPHAHFGAFTSREQDLAAETRAALLGGITSIGWFFHEPDSYLDALPQIKDLIASHASVDIFPHPILTTEQHLAEVESCFVRHGVASFKAYMASEYFPTANDDFLYRLFERVAVLPEVIICLHAENDVIVKARTARAIESDAPGTLRDWSDARPSFAEEEAISRAAYLASLTGAEIYIVHMNSLREVECVRRLKANGLDVLSETVTHYLSLTVEHELGALVKRDPPLREAADLEALWLGVADGTIDTLGTDNVVGSLATNHAEDGVFKARLGFTSLGTHLSVCLEEGYHRRGIELERLVRAMIHVQRKSLACTLRKGRSRSGLTRILPSSTSTGQRRSMWRRWKRGPFFSVAGKAATRMAEIHHSPRAIGNGRGRGTHPTGLRKVLSLWVDETACGRSGHAERWPADDAAGNRGRCARASAPGSLRPGRN